MKSNHILLASALLALAGITSLRAETPAAPAAAAKATPTLAELQKAYTEAAQGGKGEPKMVMPLLYKLIKAFHEAGDRKGGLALLAQVEKDYADHAEKDKIKPFIANLKGTLNAAGPGEEIAIAFTYLDGKKIDLAAMKGKVVLVDFWATWCGPCVGELPNVKAAYIAYHDKGFEIIAISLDQDETKLRTFIKDKEMPWPQFFDGKGWQNELATKNGIHSIPATYLIGKDGKIVATNLRGPALETKLAELCK